MFKLKKLVAMTIAVACVFALAVSASAATTSSVNGQVLVLKKDNDIKSVDAYFTTDAILPTIANTDTDSTKTVNDDNTITIAVPIKNSVFKFIGFGKDDDGNVLTSGTGTYTINNTTYSITGAVTATGTSTDSGNAATELTFTIPADQAASYIGKDITFTACVAYAMPHLVTIGNVGEHIFNVTVRLNG